MPEVPGNPPHLGFIRSPWDWYVSVYSKHSSNSPDVRRKKPIPWFELFSRGAELGFADTVKALLTEAPLVDDREISDPETKAYLLYR